MTESKPKRFIYFPSLSAGGSADAFKKNKDVQPGLTSRFYAEEFPEEKVYDTTIFEEFPFRLIRVCQHYPIEGNRAKAFRSFKVIFLRGGQQGMQHFNRRFEHLHKL